MNYPALFRATLTALLLPISLSAATSLVPLAEPQLWQRAEWRLEGAPTAENNFDPDLVRIDATFTAVSGATMTVPAFWFQDYTRALVDGAQVLTATGESHWRVRFTPTESGLHRLAITATLKNAAPTVIASTEFTITPTRLSSPLGWVRRAADPRYLETSDGSPLRLIGANACWGGDRATYDFDDWFPAMRAAGENFARLWFAPWSMGIEHTPGTLNRYDLGEAWECDHVLNLAEQNGLYVLIAMEHHGMFMSNDPAWGGSNNFWTRSSPYAVENGGPCAGPNEFFTSPEARKLYQKRLRYVIARWGYSPRMLSWQFFNEIDNSYQPRALLVGDDVVAWHREMGQWLRANDPYQHLISTSLTGASVRPEFWTMPEMDFTVYHSYGEADPARHVAKIAADMVAQFKKPVMIGEIGTSAWGWNIANDPYLRGFRQGQWGGLLGGSMGTSIAWWWESIHTDNAYPLYTVLRDVMTRAGWNQGTWVPATFVESGPAPVELGVARADGEPFTASLSLNRLRLNPVSGTAAIGSPLAAERAAERISSYLHGTTNPHLQQHAQLHAWFAANARLVFRVNSVAADADLLVRVDGQEKLRAPLKNIDGVAVVNNELNQEFAVDLPAGQHRVEIAHTGTDWVNLESIRLERVLPAPFAGGWEFATEAIGLRKNDTNTAVVYVRSPHVAWPAGALRYNPPMVRGAVVTLKDWPAVPCEAVWIDPASGREVMRTSVTTARNNTLPLSVPDFNDDLVAIVTALPATH